MIFVKVDVGLPSHHRLLAVPRQIRMAALGVWLTANCYTRDKQLDGFCPLEVLVAAGATQSVVDALVTVGLFAKAELQLMQGIRVVNYEKHNELKADIVDRQAYDRARKRAGSLAPPNPEESGIPYSHSGSFSGSGSPSETMRIAAAPVAGGVHPMREDFTLTAERRAYAEMVPVTDVDAVFKKFSYIAVEKQWHFDDAGWDARWRRFCDDEGRYQRVQRERARPTVTEPPHDGPAIRAERARRDREYREAQRNAVPAPKSLLDALKPKKRNDETDPK